MKQKNQDVLSDNIVEALQYAMDAHGNQVRKYTGEPYITHLIEVMMLVKNHGGDENQQIAAILHDVIEDCKGKVNLGDITLFFGVDVSNLVDEVTDKFLIGNRAARKKAEAERLWTISDRAQTIKYADLISNSKSIIEYDKDFAKVYLKEKAYILEGMKNGDSRLFWLAHDIVASGMGLLAI